MNSEPARLLLLTMLSFLASCASQGASGSQDARDLLGQWTNAEPMAAADPGQVHLEIRPDDQVEVWLDDGLRLPFAGGSEAGGGSYRFDYRAGRGRLTLFLAGELREGRFEVRGDELLLWQHQIDPQTGTEVRKSVLRLRRAAAPKPPRAGRISWRTGARGIRPGARDVRPGDAGLRG